MYKKATDGFKIDKLANFVLLDFSGDNCLTRRPEIVDPQRRIDKKK